MTTNTNEMDSAAYVAAASSTAAETMPTLPSDVVTTNDGSAPDEINMDVTIGNPVSNHDLTPESVFVYANNITPVTSEPGSTIASFDVVFAVNVVDSATGSTSTHQVVKRIGVDKMKMANDAKMSTPISIVEAKKPESSMLSAARIKALAGIK